MQNSEENMEKKQSSNRPSSVPPKNGNGAEYNKKENGQYTKQQYSRQPRRREANTNGRWNDAANSSSRFTQSPKSRGYERQTKSRTYSDYRQGEEVSDNYEAEIGSALMTGSKKQNLNHLLNFKYTARETQRGRATRGYGSAGGTRHKNWTKPARYNKEQFLQANCQFIVRDDCDYSIYSADPDTLVEWDFIQQVRTCSHEESSCPICLYPPVAAKITRCGHIYCWACMLHYLSLDEDNKCPICFEPVLQNDLKSVVATQTHQFSVGEEITMRLMKKAKGSAIALPIAQWQDCTKPLTMKAYSGTKFSKLLLATKEDIQDIIDGERLGLNQQKSEEGDSLTGSFVDAAMKHLLLREEDLHSDQRMTPVPKPPAIPGLPPPSPPPLGTTIGKKENVFTYASAFSDDEEEVENEPSLTHKAEKLDLSESPASTDDNAIPPGLSHSPPLGPPAILMEKETRDVLPVDEAAEQLEIPLPGGKTTQRKKQERLHDDDFFYFYQSDDGQNIYMHSLNARCLLRDYGTLENCPETITARIEELEGISMTQELRRRLRYLNHLPFTCEFQVAELTLKAPLVSKETLRHYFHEIESRRRARQKKARLEKNHNRRVEAKERQAFAKYNDITVVRSEQHSNPQPIPTTSSTGFNDYTETVSASDKSPSSPVLVSPDGMPQSISFAQMLRSRKSSVPNDAWPRVNKSVMGATSSKTAATPDSDNEDHVAAPMYQQSFCQSFGDAIQAAIDTSSSEAGNKKKKKGKKLLFTTTVNRSK
ncbi:E3 ubiquitin-protein ligase RNF10-like [Tubulanus polymorphus]|uniref:E3 ubiquitin-protein ligase RNF10-like n=1 Tax=Tubulanus polymorphus TaxID=672921 RepID=UPI003DA45710